jgi:hypothetical protein
MADDLQVQTVSCAGGLDTSRDVLSQGQQQPGSAVRLINYEPSLNGGYRRISGFTNTYGTVSGTGKILGVCVANGVDDGIFACRAPSSGSDYLHSWNATTESWDAVTTSGSPTMSGVSKVRIVPYNFTQDRILLVDGVNPAAFYDGTTYTQITSSTAPSAPSIGVAFKNHIFLAGDSSDPYNLHFSAPFDETDFTPASGAGSINVGFEIVQIKPFRDELYIFGTNQIKKLAGTSIADFQVATVTSDLGCIAADSVIEIAGDLLFLGPDGLRPVSGTDKIGDVNLETVSKPIQAIISDIIENQDLDKLSTVVVRQKSQFRIFFETAETLGIIGGLRQNPNGISFEFGQLLGVDATCASSGYVGKTEYVIHGDSSGKVHRQELGTSFDNTDIFSLFQTPYFYFGDTELRKIFYKVATFFRSEGTNSIVMSVVYDYEDNQVSNPGNFTLTTEGAAAFYNEALYDSTAIYDGNPSPVIETNFSGSGKSVSFRYVTNDSNASHNIQGLSILFGLGDRR